MIHLGSVWALRDELEKIATRLSASDMVEVMRKVSPEVASAASAKPYALPRLTEMYRKALRTSSPIEVPLPYRLANYKNWKSTGTLTPLLTYRGEVEGFSKSSPRYRYDHEPGMKTLFSGGSSDSLAAAVTRPLTRLDHDILLPGRLTTDKFGLYATPDASYARRYAGRGQGTPAIATVQVPKRGVVYNDAEHIIPAASAGDLTSLSIKPVG